MLTRVKKWPLAGKLLAAFVVIWLVLIAYSVAANAQTVPNRAPTSAEIGRGVIGGLSGNLAAGGAEGTGSNACLPGVVYCAAVGGGRNNIKNELTERDPWPTHFLQWWGRTYTDVRWGGGKVTYRHSTGDADVSAYYHWLLWYVRDKKWVDGPGVGCTSNMSSCLSRYQIKFSCCRGVDQLGAPRVTETRCLAIRVCGPVCSPTTGAHHSRNIIKGSCPT